MGITKCIVIGWGWRADFFYRIAKALPDEFIITAAVLRTKERAAEAKEKYGVFATDSLEEALATKPDYALLCIPRDGVADYLVELMKRQVPVLCETPPAKDLSELNALWENKKKYEGKVQIVEQYFLQPYYAALLDIVEQGVIGEVSNITLSALHGYHAVSIFRKMLGVGMEHASIRASRFSFPVTDTNSRQGITTAGEVKMADRSMAVLEFVNKKTAFLDFAGEQYFSLIRTRRLNIQGLRGEINDMTVRYLDKNNEAFCKDLVRLDDGLYNNSGWTHRGIQFGEQFVYRNPFYGARLNDDEIAVADCMRRMKQYVDTGKDFYPLREALQDTYLSFMIEEAAESGAAITTAKQAWTE